MAYKIGQKASNILKNITDPSHDYCFSILNILIISANLSNVHPVLTLGQPLEIFEGDIFQGKTNNPLFSKRSFHTDKYNKVGIIYFKGSQVDTSHLCCTSVHRNHSYLRKQSRP